MSRAMARRLKRVDRRSAKPSRAYVSNGEPDEDRMLTEEEWARMYVYTEESKADGSEPK